jgi:hypothetical protein
MHQMTKSIYTVDAGEVVSVEIVGTGVLDFATMALDGVKQKPVSARPLTFSFAVMVLAGESHSVTIECLFPGQTPDDARFDIKVLGSFGGVFQSHDIAKHDPPPHRRIIQFQYAEET